MYQLPPGAPSAETVDIADVARTVRRQWRAVATCTALGLLVAGGVAVFAPRKFDGRATLLARAAGASPGSITGRMTEIGDLLGGIGGLGMSGTFETELQVLRSRALAGQVVDSLGLQVRVRDPDGTAPTAIVAGAALPGSFAPRKMRFERAAGGYRASDDDSTFMLQPGKPGWIGIGTLTLRADSLPHAFTLQFYDREDAITRATKHFTINKAGGDIARIVYRGDDSLTAAAGANALIKFYLDRRKTTDRGINERKVEFVSRQLDSTGRELAQAERDLRRYQEETQVLDAEAQGQVQIEAAAALRRTLTDLQVDEAAVKQLLAQAHGGRISSRDLAAYPQFIRGSAVTPLAQQLSDFELQRIRMLERRTERDPEVIALDSTLRKIERNIVGLAESYAASVTRQREQVQSRLDAMQAQLLALPAAAERVGRLQRDVKRLTAIYTALEAQLVEARLASIGEGGDVKQVDVAVPSRKPAFPKPVLTMGLGAAGGLVAGMVAALFLGWFGRWLRDPLEIERAMGVSAQRIDGSAPLLVSGAAGARSVLVVPLEPRATAGAAAVAERLARTARQRAPQATIMDLTVTPAGNGNGRGGIAEERVSPIIEQMEQEHGMVIVQLPGLSSDVTIAALSEQRPVILVAPPGPVDRARLGHALDTLRRLHAPCAGVVVSDGPTHRALS